MKLLAAFVAVCLAMIGVVAWYVLRTEWSPPTPPRAPAASAASVQPQPATPPERAVDHAPPPAAASAPSAAASAAVRWPQDPNLANAARRLARARDTLRAEPYHETALRDELRALADLGLWSDALTPMTHLVDLHPDDLNLLFDQAAILLRLRLSVEAIEVLNRIVADDPHHARAWFNLGVAHQSLGHLEEARRAWDRTIALDPQPAARAQRAVVLLDLQEWAAAVADLEQVLEADPHSADATLNLALALSKLGRLAEAAARLAGFLDHQPRHVPVLNRLIEIELTLLDASPDDAAAMRRQVAERCRRSLELNPDQPDVAAWLADLERR